MRWLYWGQGNLQLFDFALLVLAVCLIGGGSPAGATGYSVDHARSYLLAVTGKAGIFGFAGHEHAVLATEWSMKESIDPSNLSDSSVTITIPATSLVIDSAEAREIAGLGSGPGDDDVRKIQKQMLGPRVLDAGKYPHIQFTTTSVEIKGNDELLLTGEFQMHGRSREVQVPVRYTLGDQGGVGVSGQFAVKQTDFGIEPSSAGAGTVKVANEVQIRFQISLAPAP